MIPINSPESALKALDHEDAGIRYHGAWWLGKHRAVEAVPKLMQCLNDERDRTAAGGYPLRRQAARSLGMIRDSSCTPELIKTLETEDVQLHEATLRALIEIEDIRCLDALTTYLDKDVKDKPVEALIEALTAHKAWDCREKIRPYLESDSERITSSAASFFFCCTGETAYLNMIISLLDHSNRFIRQSAAFDLARVANVTAAKPIIGAQIPNNIKMFAIKSILNASIVCQDIPTKKTTIEQTENQRVLYKELDNLTRENFSGNLLIDRKKVHKNPPPKPPTATKASRLSDAYSNLRSPSLTEREQGIKSLVHHAEKDQLDLLNLYFCESDQDIKMGLIKAMAELKKTDYLPALFDAIGVEIGNHCQGNIRRVAACALGDIDWRKQLNTPSFNQTIEKLEWTLKYPDDWGLRYSACLALEAINTTDALNLLHKAGEDESDAVVTTRIAMALSDTGEHPSASISIKDDNVHLDQP